MERFWTTPAALNRYRVMAMIVGTGLATLCFVGVPLQLIGHNQWPWNSVVEIVGTAHGFLYIVYLIVSLDLASRARFRTVQLLGMVGAGLLPLLAFYMERKVTERVRAQLALGDAAPPGPAATLWAALLRRPGAAEAPGTTRDDATERPLVPAGEVEPVEPAKAGRVAREIAAGG
jgi:integral membrane protein